MLESTWVECVAFPDRELAASRSVQHRLPSLHRLPIAVMRRYGLAEDLDERRTGAARTLSCRVA